MKPDLCRFYNVAWFSVPTTASGTAESNGEAGSEGALINSLIAGASKDCALKVSDKGLIFFL